MSRKTLIKLLLILSGCQAFYAFAGELTLSPAEQSYLQEHSELSLCVDPDWLPYERLNEVKNRHSNQYERNNGSINISSPCGFF